MPNWCFNSVIVSAKTEAELTDFLDFCDQTHTSHHKNWDGEVEVDENAKGVFWNFVTPTDLEAYWGNDTFSSTNNDNADFMTDFVNKMENGMDWYHWNVRNWGTKWDIHLERDYITVIHNEKNDNYYFNWNFDTAWSPAVEVYEVMAKRFPNLEFDFEITEEANFYLGKLNYAGGELVSQNWVDDPSHADFMEFDLPCSHCNWGEDVFDLSVTDLDQLDEQLGYYYDDCPPAQQLKDRIAELSIDNPSEDVLELSLSTTTQKEN